MKHWVGKGGSGWLNIIMNGCQTAYKGFAEDELGQDVVNAQRLAQTQRLDGRNNMGRGARGGRR